MEEVTLWEALADKRITTRHRPPPDPVWSILSVFLCVGTSCPKQSTWRRLFGQENHVRIGSISINQQTVLSSCTHHNSGKDDEAKGKTDHGMSSMRRRHTSEEVEQKDGHELGQQGTNQPLILGRELVEAQPVFEQLTHFSVASIWLRSSSSLKGKANGQRGEINFQLPSFRVGGRLLCSLSSSGGGWNGMEFKDRIVILFIESASLLKNLKSHLSFPQRIQSWALLEVTKSWPMLFFGQDVVGRRTESC